MLYTQNGKSHFQIFPLEKCDLSLLMALGIFVRGENSSVGGFYTTPIIPDEVISTD
jgi:hypothetical protein